jgi:DNA polymerase-4
MKIHIDIDCFFVSAARILDSSLEHKAVAIGGRSDTKIFEKDARNQTVDFKNSGNFVPIFYKAYEKKDDTLQNFRDEKGQLRGVITTSSYEARAYGVKTAMSIQEALFLCPQLIVKSPNMSFYQELSHKLHLFLMKHIPLVEQASIDEFYGDVSGWVSDKELPSFIDELRHNIKKELKLPVSIGAAKTRYIAKMATNYAKPFGSKVIDTYNFDECINPLKVEKFTGIGKKMQKRLHAVQITTLGELRKHKGMLYAMGPYAKEIYKRVNGESDTPINIHVRRKSIGISRTFTPLYQRNEVLRRIHILARHLSFAVSKLRVIPTSFQMHIGYEMQQKSHFSFSQAELFYEKKFHDICVEMFHKADKYKRLHIIRISIHCGHFTRDSKRELSLLNFNEDIKMLPLNQLSQQLRAKYGLDILKWGGEL